MADPWTKKGFVLSMVLGGANAWAGMVRGVMEGATKRQRAMAINQGFAQLAGSWTAGPTPMASRRKHHLKQRCGTPTRG